MVARLGVAVLFGVVIVAGPALASPAFAASPTVTIDQAPGQTDPTSTAPVSFAVEFSEPVTGFAADDVQVSGTVGGALSVSVSGTGAAYTVAISGMTSGGTLIATVEAGAATDSAGNSSEASTSTDNTVTWIPPVPSATINQGPTQSDPTSSDPISFAVEFSVPVTGFDATDVNLSGTVGGTLVANVSGSGSAYTVTVSGMTTNGTVIATIPADAAVSAAGIANTASTSTDNTVTWQQPVSSSPSPSPSPSVSPGAPPPGTTPSASVSAPAGEMPVTGTKLGLLLVAAILLMLAGTGLVYVVRRRRLQDV
jgi:LPXTG-motif cell wall-anchored protein